MVNSYAIDTWTMTTTTLTTTSTAVTATAKLSELNATSCFQAWDECGNMCHRSVPISSTWWRSCEQKACTPQSAFCLASTDDEIPTQVVPPFLGNDKDEHGCIGSAGYSWSQSQQTCVKIWEYSATDDEKAYDFAFNLGMTTMKTLKDFRLNDKITRQEAAKMFVAYAENAFGAKYASYPEDCNVVYLDEKLFGPTLKDFIYSACALDIMKGSDKSFMPNANISKGQTLAVIMRIADGRQKEPKVQSRWINYVTRASDLGYLSFPDVKELEYSITRWEVIKWAYSIYLKHTNTQK